MENNNTPISRSVPNAQRKELPLPAQEILARIDVMLAYVTTSFSDLSTTNNSSYTLNETHKRYVPDTVSAYLAIPKPLRDDTALHELIQQLTSIESAILNELNHLSDDKKAQLRTNGLFIEQRFTSKEVQKNTGLEEQIQRDATQLQNTPDAPENLIYRETKEQILETENWKKNKKRKTVIKLTTFYTALFVACTYIFYAGEHSSTQYQTMQSVTSMRIVAHGLIAKYAETGSYPLAKLPGTVHDVDVTRSLVNSPEMDITTPGGEHYKYTIVNKNTFILTDPETPAKDYLQKLPKANDGHHLPQPGGSLCENDCKHLGYSNETGYFGY